MTFTHNALAVLDLPALLVHRIEGLLAARRSRQPRPVRSAAGGAGTAPSIDADRIVEQHREHALMLMIREGVRF